MRKSILPILLLLIRLPVLSAQAQIVLFGHVVYDKGPIEDVEVSVAGVGSDHTTSSGEFRIKIPYSLIGQTIVLTVMKNGWAVANPDALRVTIPVAGAQLPLTIRMKSSPSPSVRPLVRRSKKSRAAVNDYSDNSKNGFFRTRILVANFYSVEGTPRTSLAETIITKLQAATTKYRDDIEIQGLDTIITEQQGSRMAQEIGRKHGANIVIWGWFSLPKIPDANVNPRNINLQVDAHFEVLMKPNGLIFRQENEQYLAQIADLTNHSIHIQLSKDMSYLTLFTMGLARLQNEDYEGAIDRLTEALKIGVAPDQMIDPSDLYLIRGRAYLDQATYSLWRQRALDEAIADLNQVLTRRTDDPQAFNLRGRALFEKGEIDEALRDWYHVVEMDPFSRQPGAMLIFEKVTAHIAIVDYLYNIGDIAGAEKYLGRAFQLSAACRDDTVSATSLARLIAIALNHSAPLFREYIDQAIAAINKLLNTFKIPDRRTILANSLTTAGLLLLRAVLSYARVGIETTTELDKGLISEFLADIDRVIKLWPVGPIAFLAHCFAARIYQEKGQYPRALSHLARAVRAKSLYPSRQYGSLQPVAISYREMGSLRDALASLDEAEKWAPNDDEILWVRGEIHRQMGDFAKAIADLSQAIRLRPGYSNWHVDRARIYGDMGDLPHAIQDLSQASLLRPEWYLPYLDRASMYEGRGELQNAIKDLTKVIALQPKDAKTLIHRSRVYEGMGEFDNAIDDLTRSIELFQSVEGYQNLIRIYKGRGELDKVSELTQHLRQRDISPEHERFSEVLSAISADSTGKKADQITKPDSPTATIESLTDEIRLRPDVPATYIKRAVGYEKEGQLDKAIDDLTKSIALNASNSSSAASSKEKGLAYTIRADIYRGRGLLNNAIDDLTSAIHLSNGTRQWSAYSKRADIYQGRGDLANAIADLSHCVELGSGGYIRLSRIYEGLGACDKAIEVWNQYTRLTLTLDRLNPDIDVEQNKGLAQVFFRTDGRSEKARLHEKVGRLDEAIKDRTEQIEMDPTRTGLYLDRRELYEALGQIDNAIDDLTKYIRAVPDRGDSYLYRGLDYLKKNNRLLAALDFKEAIRRSDEDEETKRQAEYKLRRLGSN